MEKTIRDNINNKLYEPTLKENHLNRYLSTDIIDENMTVKWNREEVIRLNRNKDINDLRLIESHKIETCNGFNDFKKDVIVMLNNKYNFDDKGKIAELIFDEADIEYHSRRLWNILNKSLELASIINGAIKIKLEDN